MISTAVRISSSATYPFPESGSRSSKYKINLLETCLSVYPSWWEFFSCVVKRDFYFLPKPLPADFLFWCRRQAEHLKCIKLSFSAMQSNVVLEERCRVLFHLYHEYVNLPLSFDCIRCSSQTASNVTHICPLIKTQVETGSVQNSYSFLYKITWRFTLFQWKHFFPKRLQNA